MEEIQRIYSKRFQGLIRSRVEVWRTLVDVFFGPLLGSAQTVLDLGAGYGEFINAVQAPKKFAIDFNPDTAKQLTPGIVFFQQDCSRRWPLEDGSLDAIFSSNFFEHLSDKNMLRATLMEAKRCLRKHGKLIALGPNIRFVPGEYWDFWDHHIPLTDRSLAELLESLGFQIDRQIPQFLPYTMSRGAFVPPAWMIKIYLRFPVLWKLKVKQFLICAAKP